ADPLQTRATHARGGWFRTGDRATIDDDGWLTVVGRIKDVVIRGGENISVAEVEGVLEAHPAVRQAAVVGYPDDILGERVAAFVASACGPEPPGGAHHRPPAATAASDRSRPAWPAAPGQRGPSGPARWRCPSQRRPPAGQCP